MVNILLQQRKSHLVALSLLFLLFSCSSHKRIAPSSTALPTDTAAMVAASSRSTLSLMQQVCRQTEGENVWLSPLSAQMALSTVHDGAKGQTAQQMQAWVTHLSLANNDQLQIASALWVTPSFRCLPAYLDQCRARGSEIYNERITATKVNHWADVHTHGKITEVLTNPLPADLAMLVANAVYFKADWMSPFRAENTHLEPFFPSEGASYEVLMMNQTAHFLYADRETYSYITLPYRPSNDGHHYALSVLLPHPGVSATQLLAGLSMDELQLCADSARRCKVELTIPKIELRYSRVLNDDYRALGMTKVFHPSEADLTGISTQRLHLGMIKQDSYLRMDEKGTEAAAVTTAQLRNMAMPVKEDIVEFVVNRPYLILLSDKDTGLVLFMGKIEKVAK